MSIETIQADFRRKVGETVRLAEEGIPDHPLEFQIVRSYDATKLYERPVSFAREKLEPERREVREVETPLGTIPAHVVWDHTSSPCTVVAYFFVFDEDVVRSAFLAQLRAAIDLELTGPRPLTLVLISGVGTPQTTAAIEHAAMDGSRAHGLTSPTRAGRDEHPPAERMGRAVRRQRARGRRRRRGRARADQGVFRQRLQQLRAARAKNLVRPVPDRDAGAKILQEFLRSGDWLLVKGSRSMHMECMVEGLGG